MTTTFTPRCLLLRRGIGAAPVRVSAGEAALTGEAGSVEAFRAAAEEARRAPGGAAGRGRGGRFSAGRKRAVVLRRLRGEDLESVSRAGTMSDGSAAAAPADLVENYVLRGRPE